MFGVLPYSRKPPRCGCSFSGGSRSLPAGRLRKHKAQGLVLGTVVPPTSSCFNQRQPQEQEPALVTLHGNGWGPAAPSLGRRWGRMLHRPKQEVIVSFETICWILAEKCCALLIKRLRTCPGGCASLSGTEHAFCSCCGSEPGSPPVCFLG